MPDRNIRTPEGITIQEFLGVFANSNNIKRNYEESLLDDLITAFKENFHGHYPKIIEAYALVASNYKILPEDIINKFNQRIVSQCVDRHIPWVETVILTHFFEIEDVRKYLENNYNRFPLKYFNKGKEEEINRIKWCLRHPETESSIKVQLLDKKLDVELTDNVTAIKAKIIEADARKEVKKIEKEYGYGDMKFKFDECEFDLRYTTSENDRYKAYIMEKGDVRMVKLGEYTCCCQELGEPGETAMMHGLINPKAGFWVIEDKVTGKIFAQAEIWELDDNTIVFDNIEFADGRTIHHEAMRKMIGMWAYECAYENVIMGTINNLDLTYEMLDNVEFIVTPRLTAEELYLLDDDDRFDCFMEAEEAFRTGRYNYDDFVYTDADDGNAVYLKKQGQVQDFLWEAIKDKVEVIVADEPEMLGISHLSKIKESPVNKVEVGEKHHKRTMREILKTQIENDIRYNEEDILRLWDNIEDFINDKYGLTFEDLNMLGIELSEGFER